jgi:hypothetical protein
MKESTFKSEEPIVVKPELVRLTPEQVEEKAQLVAMLMAGLKALMENIHEDDLTLITNRAEVIDPKVFENFD